jgi:hypothetical protein
MNNYAIILNINMPNKELFFLKKEHKEIIFMLYFKEKLMFISNKKTMISNKIIIIS